MQRRDVYGAWEQYLGLEHPDNAPKRIHAAYQVISMLGSYAWAYSVLGKRTKKIAA